jgi:hypothetical protein
LELLPLVPLPELLWESRVAPPSPRIIYCSPGFNVMLGITVTFSVSTLKLTFLVDGTFGDLDFSVTRGFDFECLWPPSPSSPSPSKLSNEYFLGYGLIPGGGPVIQFYLGLTLSLN